MTNPSPQILKFILRNLSILTRMAIPDVNLLFLHNNTDVPLIVQPGTYEKIQNGVTNKT